MRARHLGNVYLTPSIDPSTRATLKPIIFFLERVWKEDVYGKTLEFPETLPIL
jgi:hypothetical protein